MNNQVDVVVRPQDYEQVLFMGWNSIELKGLLDVIPVLDGSFADVSFYTSHFRGLRFTENIARSIDVKRIIQQPVIIGGKRTLPIMADLYSVDNNRSFLDLVTHEKDRVIDRLKLQNKFLVQQTAMLLEFIRAKNLEEDFKERMLNMAEHNRVISQKLHTKPSEAPGVSVEVGTSEEKPKRL